MQNRNFIVEEIAPKTLRIDEFGLDTIYLVCGEKEALVVDTGTGFRDLRGFIESQTSLPYKVVATHGHMDNIGGRLQFDEMYLHEKDLQMIPIANYKVRKMYANVVLNTYKTENPLFSMGDMTEGEEPKIINIKQGDIFDLGNRKLRVYETPGHSQGSLCLLDEKEKILFSGDSFQPIMLLTMDDPDRDHVLKLWLENALKVYGVRDEFNMICGGHEKVEYQILSDLIECAKGLMDGSITMQKIKIHIFDGMFAKCGKAHMTTDQIESILSIDETES
ncbi:MAG: MBL fold metallo-hydrolase [Anaerocolumna sp.]